MKKGKGQQRETPLILQEIPRELEEYESPELTLYILESTEQAFSQIARERVWFPGPDGQSIILEDGIPITTMRP